MSDILNPYNQGIDAAIAVCLERAKYFDRTTGHYDRSDAARSYRATADELAALRRPVSPATDTRDAPDEKELARLVAAYYRREIGRLMQQAEHWAEHGKPLAVHHRLRKADAYFQIVALFERFEQWGENPFEVMRKELARKPIWPPGNYPPSADLDRYREPAFVVEHPSATDTRDAVIAELLTALKPFADEATRWTESQESASLYCLPIYYGDGPTVGDLRRARAALSAVEGSK